MPMPKRSSVDDFFAQLNDVQRPHLEALREMSRDADPEAREELKWNLPVYVRGKQTSLWMLQNFKNHCSLRFPPPFFATQKVLTDTQFGDAADIRDGDEGRPANLRNKFPGGLAGRGAGVGEGARFLLDLNDGGAGGGAVKVAGSLALRCAR
jgi:hypothetical protein